MARALIAAVDRDLADALATALAERGWETAVAHDADAALRAGQDVELVCWALPRPAGASPGQRLPGAQLVGVASRGQGAVAAAALGADDCLELPLEPSELALLLRRAGERTRERRARRLQGRELRRAVGDRPIVAASPVMIELLEALERVAALEAGVLLHGERGTGKETLARALHALSPRRAEPFVALACAELGARELATELFGRPAASPGDTSRPGLLQDADGGTLFLDDVHALPAALQDELAAVLRRDADASARAPSRRLDLRVLAATSADLGGEVAAGRFRKDLYECIAALALEVPPLRARGLDLPLLLDHLLAQACRRHNRAPLVVGEETLARIVAYAWPGNLPELESALARAVARATGGRLGLEHLPAEVSSPSPSDPGLGLRAARKRFEVELIRRALRATGGNRTHAARLLKISHRALLYKLKEHGIE
ncbi:MAG TPA: sigma 54-interacting transcriptional regulator [Myxococcota bacterium]|nr:sigma 54-interacting transcriptional regulator [Myxococcota bacterium]